MRQDFLCFHRLVGARKIGPVAPVLPGAEEEDLHACHAVLFGQRKDIGLLDAARIDPLMALYHGKRGEPVAINGSPLEIERFGSFLHLAGKGFLDRRTAARQELLGLGDQLRIVAKRYLAGTRRRAALDLVEQAWAGAGFIDAVGTGADQECPLHGVDRASHCTGRGKRPEIVTFLDPRAAMLEDPWCLVIVGNHDIGKALVVAQQHVEAWP